MDIEEMLREQFTAVIDGLEPVADLVPSALREGRRQRSARRSRMLVATVSAGAVAASAATLAAAHIGAGRSPSGRTVTQAAFLSEVQATLAQLFPGTEVTVRPETVLGPPRPTVDPTPKLTSSSTPATSDVNGRKVADQERDLWSGPEHAAYYTVTMHNAAGTVNGVLMLSYQPGETTPLTVSKSCQTESDYLFGRGLQVTDCYMGTRSDYTVVLADDVRDNRTAADGGAPKHPEPGQPRRFVGGNMYHDVLYGLTLYGDVGNAPPAGISLAQMFGAEMDMRFAQLIDAWLAVPGSRSGG